MRCFGSIWREITLILPFMLAGNLTSSALAQAPQPWEMALQPAASPVMEHITSLYDTLTWIISGIVILVFGLLGYVIWRFRAKRNPVPATFHGNFRLEVAWTFVPVLILAAIAVPSFDLLFYMDKAQNADMTLKVIGHQWYWSYSYPDNGGFSLDSYYIDDGDIKGGQVRLLETDSKVVLPVGATIRVIITSDDVIHSFSVPSLGLKTDAVPGRLNETWVRVTKPGLYYGQCAQLCGANHTFMPIDIEAVPKSDFLAWADAQRKKLAAAQ
jgi:cytochrome c oxidase subunit 2